MRYFLGIDTSNYTTSAAIADENGIVVSEKKLLPVALGQKGLRQSDALFSHTKQLPEIISRLGAYPLTAVGFSARPRDVEGSYMPCFLAGQSVALSVASLAGVPAYDFSHQAGHIAAALYSCGHEELHGQEFLAFHVSGGTTDLLRVRADETIERIGGTDDINAGQLIDRVGVMLGLAFPCGPELEKLAGDFSLPKLRPCVHGLTCNLSGVENQAARLLAHGTAPCDIARFAVTSVLIALDIIVENAMAQFGTLPILFAGGVMSNRSIRRYMEDKYHGFFAEPFYSSDNAAGTALLCRNRYFRELL